MKQYRCILFDADDTLFHFDAFSGLKLMFSRFDVSFSDHDFAEYQLINRPLWVAYQNNTITSAQLQIKRFELWAQRLNCLPQVLSEAFLEAMADIGTPIEGAFNLLNSLQGKYKLGIITNGFTRLQEIRLKKAGLRDYFDVLVISEQLGVPKPSRKIFDHTLELLAHTDRESVLMVGDNPDSDILGGLNAGIDTCWFNPEKSEHHPTIKPHYMISTLYELEQLLAV